MTDTATSTKQYGLCMALGVLLGPLGVHRCYLGRWPTGFVQGAGTVACIVWLVLGAGRADFRPARFDVWPVLWPMLALLAWGAWPAADVAVLLAGRFRDAGGAVVRP